LATKTASVRRKRSFFIGLALTGFRPRIVSITKRAIWQANSTLAVWISVKNARRRVLAYTGLPVCGLRMSQPGAQQGRNTQQPGAGCLHPSPRRDPRPHLREPATPRFGPEPPRHRNHPVEHAVSRARRSHSPATSLRTSYERDRWFESRSLQLVSLGPYGIGICRDRKAEWPDLSYLAERARGGTHDWRGNSDASR